jgi:steroid delta-isomerase-like uncharacterized protein
MEAPVHVNEATMQRWFEEVWNQRREETIDEIMTPDTVVYGLGPEPLKGSAGFKAFYESFGRAFPDLRVEVVSVVCDGDRVAMRFRSRGTHTGDTMGPPSNRAISMEGAVFARFDNDTIVEAWNLVDFLTMYQQLGWLPATVGPA